MTHKPLDLSLDLMQAAEGYERSGGLHASDIYGSLYKLLQPKRYARKTESGDEDAMDPLRIFVGLGIEEKLERILVKAGLGHRPKEKRTKDGIAYSPDFLFFQNGHDAILGEFKTTYMSPTGWPNDPKFDKYHCQTKFYLHSLEIQTCWFFPFFMNGRPKGEIPGPVFLPTVLTYTQRELNDNRKMLDRHRERMEAK